MLVLALGLGVRVWRAAHGDSGAIASVRLSGPSEVSFDREQRFRVVARDRQSGAALADEAVQLGWLSEDAKAHELATLRTDAAGVAVFDVRLPPARSSVRLRAVLPRRGPDASDETTVYRSVPVTFVSSDKPLYQPGQTIHFRALTLSADERPMRGLEATLEVVGPAGSTLWRKVEKTSEFGIVHGDVPLAAEAGPGTYTLRVAFGPFSNEHPVEVKRYSLPKLEARIELARDLLEPGEKLAGTVSARYFFGEPAVSATVTLRAADDRALARGVTDAAGRFRFEITPDTDAPLLELRASVQTTPGQSAEALASVALARELEVEVFPENGVLVPGVENQLWLVTSVAGRPRSAEVTLEPAGNKVRTSAQGLAKVPFTPREGAAELVLRARDDAGLEVERAIRPAAGGPSLLVRCESPVISAKQPAKVTVLAPGGAGGDVLLSLWKDERVLSTSRGTLARGRAELSLPVPGGAHGLVRVEAEAFPGDASSLGGRTLALAEPGGKLALKASLDRPSYAPGDKAKLGLELSRRDGAPLKGAFGVAAVDEAFFALSQVRPDLEQRFFALDRELEALHASGRAEFAKFVDSDAPGLLDGADPAQDDARRVTLALLSERLPPRSAAEARFDPGELEQLRAKQKRRVLAWAGLAPWTLGMTLLAWFAVYGFYRSLVPMVPTVVDDQRRHSWLHQTRMLALAWVAAVLVPPLVGALTDVYLRPLDATARQVRTALTWVLCALLFSSLQMLVVRRLRRDPLAALHPGYSFAIGLLPAAILLLQAGAALSLGFNLRPYEHWLGSSTSFILVLCVGAIGIALVFGLLSILAHSALALPSAGRRAWLLVSRACLLGLPLSLWALVDIARGEHDRFWVMIYEFAGSDSAAPAARSAASNVRYAVAGPRSNGRTSKPSELAGRARSYFPETLLWLPELATDAHGRASVEIPLADSITTYRVAVTAVDSDGELASALVPLRVNQDFFVDVSLPAELTQGDEVYVPVTVFNYLEQPQAVTLRSESDGLIIPGKAEQQVALGAGEVRGLRLRLRALNAGEHVLKVVAQGAKLTDTVQRSTKVAPRGMPVVTTYGGLLGDAASVDVLVPPEALPGTTALYAKIYGSDLSQLGESLSGTFGHPDGSLEQTASATEGSALVLAWLQKSHAASGELGQKALSYVEDGYQRLVAFQAGAGGFSWFPGEEPSALLTARALQAFTEASGVWPVATEPSLAARKWLLDQHKRDKGFASGANALRENAYIVRALAEAGEKDPRLGEALAGIAGAPQSADAYTISLVASALVAGGQRDKALPMLKELAGLAQKDGELVSWSAAGESLWSGRGQSFVIETTALAAWALGLADLQPELRRGAFAYLRKQRLHDGTWPSSAATSAALRALLQDAKPRRAADQKVSVTVAGVPAGEVTVAGGASDVEQLLGLSDKIAPGLNRVALKSSSPGDLAYQLVSTYYVPWERAVSAQSRGPLSISVMYGAVSAVVGSAVDCEVEVRWNEDRPRPMGMIEIAIPPGFDLETDELEGRERTSQVRWFSREKSKLIVYVDEFSALDPIHVRYRLRPLYPVQVLVPASVAYPYYQPELRAETRPMTLSAR